MQPLLRIKDASIEFDSRSIWRGINIDVSPGEFIAVIGSNGSGKSLLLKSIVGLQKLSGGSITLEPHTQIGYIPQHRPSEQNQPIKVRDLVRFGLDGEQYGISIPTKQKLAKVAKALNSVDVSQLAEQEVSRLSGGEFQRVRVAQAMISNPKLVLADEPLSALDLHHQMTISELIYKQSKEQGSAVLFVTHDLNPIISFVDRVLYLAHGKYSIGTVDEVMTSRVLTDLYGYPIDVVRNQGRIVVLGSHDHDHHDHEEWK